MTIYIQYMYPMFTQISHIHSHLLLLIAEATLRFCLVFTTRGVSEMELERGGSPFDHDACGKNKMISCIMGKPKIAGANDLYLNC